MAEAKRAVLSLVNPGLALNLDATFILTRAAIAQMRRAMADGVDVRGYFPWTLVDNYEWKEGWHGQFGLFSFDKKTKARNLEPTGKWFSAYIKAHPNP
jgi:beta-glucosidase/6-phospho-beta-glucosidase/beta-galactosidase